MRAELPTRARSSRSQVERIGRSVTQYQLRITRGAPKLGFRVCESYRLCPRPVQVKVNHFEQDMHSLTRLRGGLLPPWPYGTQRGGQSGPVHFKHLIIGAEMLRCCGEKARFTKSAYRSRADMLSAGIDVS